MHCIRNFFSYTNELKGLSFLIESEIKAGILLIAFINFKKSKIC